MPMTPRAMCRWMLLAAALGATMAHEEASSMCQIKNCNVKEGGSTSTCERSSTTSCPPCLSRKWELSEFGYVYTCQSLNSNDECPRGTTLCTTVPVSSHSGSSSGSKKSSSSSKSGSGSGSTTIKTTKPTTKKPTNSSSSGSGTHNATVTVKPKATTTAPPVSETTQPLSSANKDSSSNTKTEDSKSSSSLPIILGVGVTALVAVAAIMFLVWRRRRADDDDESDDEEYRYNGNKTNDRTVEPEKFPTAAAPAQVPQYNDAQMPPPPPPMQPQYAVPASSQAPAPSQSHAPRYVPNYAMPLQEQSSARDNALAPPPAYETSAPGAINREPSFNVDEETDRDTWGTSGVQNPRQNRSSSAASVEF